MCYPTTTTTTTTPLPCFPPPPPALQRQQPQQQPQQDQQQAKMMMTPDEWRLCQMLYFKPSTSDLLSDEMELADECHMKLEEDDEVSIALKELKREKLAQQQLQQHQQPQLQHQHKRTPSDLTDVTQALSDESETETDLSFLDECMVAHQAAENLIIEQPLVCMDMEDDFDDSSCVDDVFRLALEYPCSDADEAMTPLLCCS